MKNAKNGLLIGPPEKRVRRTAQHTSVECIKGINFEDVVFVDSKYVTIATLQATWASKSVYARFERRVSSIGSMKIAKNEQTERNARAAARLLSMRNVSGCSSASNRFFSVDHRTADDITDIGGPILAPR